MKPTNSGSLVADRSQMAKASRPTLWWSGQYKVLVVNLSLSAAALKVTKCYAINN